MRKRGGGECGCAPGALVFTVSALYNFVFSGKNLLLEYLCASALFYAGDLEDLGSINIRVTASAHDRNAPDHALVDLLDRVSISGRGGGRGGPGQTSIRHCIF